MILWPVETRLPSAACLNLASSKDYFSRGSPTRLLSVNAKVWQPPITMAHWRSALKILSGETILSFSLVVEPTPVTPLMMRSVCVRVPVLSKQQMSILPAKGILKGSVQKICF